MVEFHCHQPNRFGKSNYGRDSRIYKQSIDSIPIWIKVKYIFYSVKLILCDNDKQNNKYTT